ncbi:hypothetical protein DFJ74DRAFT_708412 [Hyaloraphidium curvatum]|nr:hypothetical protein DFJ74DRAFT_708412 [Hyaloraphidium curvatum]
MTATVTFAWNARRYHFDVPTVAALRQCAVLVDPLAAQSEVFTVTGPLGVTPALGPLEDSKAVNGGSYELRVRSGAQRPEGVELLRVKIEAYDHLATLPTLGHDWRFHAAYRNIKDQLSMWETMVAKDAAREAELDTLQTTVDVMKKRGNRDLGYSIGLQLAALLGTALSTVDPSENGRVFAAYVCVPQRSWRWHRIDLRGVTSAGDLRELAAAAVGNMPPPLSSVLELRNAGPLPPDDPASDGVWAAAAPVDAVAGLAGCHLVGRTPLFGRRPLADRHVEPPTVRPSDPRAECRRREGRGAPPPPPQMPGPCARVTLDGRALQVPVGDVASGAGLAARVREAFGLAAKEFGDLVLLDRAGQPVLPADTFPDPDRGLAPGCEIRAGFRGAVGKEAGPLVLLERWWGAVSG